MGSREERKRKFNEAIVNMLYPPPPSPPEEEFQPVQASTEGFVSASASHSIPDDSEGYENAHDYDEQNCSPEKLTRAQRKNLRKKKLKEEAVRRGNLIGPLLPRADPDARRSPPVRSNAFENDEILISSPHDPGLQLAKKVNQRRKAKKMAKVKQKSSDSQDGNQHSTTSNPTSEKTITK